MEEAPLVEFESPEPRYFEVSAPFLTDPAGHYLKQVRAGKEEPDPAIDAILKINWVEQPDGTRKDVPRRPKPPRKLGDLLRPLR